MTFVLECDKKDSGAFKDLFRVNRKLFGYVGRNAYEDKISSFTFTPRSVLCMNKIEDVLKSEKDMGTKFHITVCV